jgi:Flp pilus assembly CpaF family ATPase
MGVQLQAGMVNLLKATLRHRPDRIIVGEVRRGEAVDPLRLLNTRHGGTISTVRANSSETGHFTLHDVRPSKAASKYPTRQT